MDVFSRPKEYGSECFQRCKSLSSLSDESVFQKLRISRGCCGYLNRQSHTASESSIEAFVVMDSDSETSVQRRKNGQRNQKHEGGVLSTLEQKIDRLNDLFEEQCRLLSEIKAEVQESKETLQASGYVQAQVAEVVNRSGKKRMKEYCHYECSYETESTASTNPRAKSLLDALEIKRASTFEAHVRETLTSLLQSEDLRARVVAATAASVRDVVRGSVSRDVSAVYLPVLQRAHRRLLSHVSRTLEDAFAELEQHSSQLSRHMYKTTCTLRHALDRHQSMLDSNESCKEVNSLRSTVEELLDKEMKQWRQKVLDIIIAELHYDYELEESVSLSLTESSLSPVSPPQPADPENTIIDQLMKSAEINKQIEDGDVNGSFERALSAADLSLVMVACRAADPAVLFAPPCSLTQSVLLSLAQQLATDMVHETQLKCRYLEDSLISLDVSNPATRTHLPLVIGEVRKYLMKFLQTYPNHTAYRRVTLIIMAADNLLKKCH